jgi:ATP-binding cassette subfamily B protein
LETVFADGADGAVIWLVNEKLPAEMSRRLRKVQESWSRVSSTLAESVSGIRVTQAFVRHESTRASSRN